MTNVADQTDEPVSRLACQDAIKNLSAEYGWSLPLDDLVERVLQAARLEATPINLDQLIRLQYKLALYEACRQTVDLDRRQRAWSDLHRYLYRAAYNHWPDLAEQVAQQALILIYEKLDTCRNPAAILAFAMGYVRWAFRMVRSENEQMLSLDAFVQRELDLALPDTSAALFSPECLHLLLNALNRMPEQQHQVIVLKYFKHLSDKTISERTGLSISNIRVMRNRGLKRLGKNRQLRESCVETQIGV
jgi:RNA polymerase sigma factor (sigma-70 family)